MTRHRTPLLPAPRARRPLGILLTLAVAAIVGACAGEASESPAASIGNGATDFTSVSSDAPATITMTDGASAQAEMPPPSPAAPAVALRAAARARMEVSEQKATGEGQGGSSQRMNGVDVNAGPVGSAVDPRISASTSAMIIRTGRATVEVDSVEIAAAQLRILAQQLGGWVANTSMDGGEGRGRSATLEIKVPSAQFQRALTGLTPMGKVESLSESAEDVGEEYVDIDARASNARRLEERLIGLLATRTGRLQDVLSVERELARVREEIERHEGRLRYLRARTSMSTLIVMLHTPVPIIAREGARGPIAAAFREAWRNVVGVTAGLIVAVGALVPPLALLGAALYGVSRWRSARRARVEARTAA